VSRNRFCDFLADPDSRSFSRFGAIIMQVAVQVRADRLSRQATDKTSILVRLNAAQRCAAAVHQTVKAKSTSTRQRRCSAGCHVVLVADTRVGYRGTWSMAIRVAAREWTRRGFFRKRRSAGGAHAFRVADWTTTKEPDSNLLPPLRIQSRLACPHSDICCDACRLAGEIATWPAAEIVVSHGPGRSRGPLDENGHGGSW
jgi:hypothetical protein